ncbi:DUF7269 family protein [Halobacterium yunchengense]|uniref:DUF7269 family protein n=1 Tax=Halobacterium yunchengense TaxID=3108497 RepID=UPI00300AFABC
MTAALRTVLAAVGVAAVAVAVGVAVGVAPSSVVGAADAVDATLATGLLGAGLLGYALRKRRRSPPASDRPLVDVRSDDGPDAPGRAVDDAVDLVREYGTTGTRDARGEVRAAVRETAVRAYASRADVDEDDAAAAVAAGEWTDDRVAAAFVGDERAPHYPLRERLRGWVVPERAFERRAERAAAAVHALATDGASRAGGRRRRPTWTRAEGSR